MNDARADGDASDLDVEPGERGVREERVFECGLRAEHKIQRPLAGVRGEEVVELRAELRFGLSEVVRELDEGVHRVR
mgnify:CR=1 FL=1